MPKCTKVQTELISEKEFEKLRNQIESEYVTSNSRVAGIAESLATYHMFFGDANLINNEIDRYLAVTREDIQAAAKKYLVKNNRVTLALPAKVAGKLNPDPNPTLPIKKQYSNELYKITFYTGHRRVWQLVHLR